MPRNGSEPALDALVSIHDVMPHTLDRVKGLLDDHLGHLPPERVVLLVVPGLPWQPAQLEALHLLAGKGFELAGHGWHHRTREIRGVYHRLHAAFISRQAAEHLCLAPGEIRALIDDCHRWFLQQGLPEPALYVPPAWAMGTIDEQALADAPFRYYETTRGYLDSASGRSLTLPLAGFEADNAFRAASLTCWNAANRWLATDRKPLRVSIHPYDADLRLREGLRHTLAAVTRAVDYRSLF